MGPDGMMSYVSTHTPLHGTKYSRTIHHCGDRVSFTKGQCINHDMVPWWRRYRWNVKSVTEMLKKCCGPRTVDVAMEWTVLDLSTAVLSFLRSTQIRRFRAVKGCVRMWQETPVSVRTVEIMRASECARTRTFQTNIQKNGGTLPHRENPSLYLAPWYLNCSSFFFRPSDAPAEICDYKLL